MAVVVCQGVDKAAAVHEQYSRCMDRDNVLLLHSGPRKVPMREWKDNEKTIGVSEALLCCFNKLRFTLCICALK